ncbi:alpha/beta hydrolase [Dictyobacter aurantiacus]|uniref:Hydrolase n=1 Tax=Dictyobacter aurantiacus TaxID=1936993 RepID=A0A401ZSG4_9CHLR|nr:alpha/beta hydrolase [Dictyobacter aurantiacus]GCE09829.1 hydrolase [Dictyobacter aurantiacus]
MSSWQAQLMNLLVKQNVKRHFRRPVDVAEFRRRLNARQRVTVPTGWQVRIVEQRPGFCDEWIEPLGSLQSSRPAPLLLYLHGGGYLACSPRSHRSLTVALAAQSGMRCLSLDYPLAPEHPFPAALEATIAVYQQFLADGEAPDRIVLAGDSAGGGLALATLLKLRELGEPLPAGAALFSPLTDLAGTGASLKTNEKSDAFFFARMILDAGRYYLDGKVEVTDPLASPLYADLSGLPPLLVHVSDSELLRDDSLRLIDRARQHGVSVESQIWRNLPHVWQIFTPFVPEARESIARTAAFLQTCVANVPVANV